MTPEEFDILLRRVGPRLARQDTELRKAIPAKDRLSLTLRFLATGESFKSLSCNTLHPDRVAKVTLAVACLHNFLCWRRSEAYLPVGLSDSEDADQTPVEGTWRSQGLGVMRPIPREQAARCSPQREEARNIIKDYFSPPTGRVT